MTLDPHVYALAAQRLRDVRYATRAEGERDVRALAMVIQRAIEDWCEEREEQTEVAGDPANDPRLP